ncbi:hypothetical protein EDD59_10616 [Muricomes intestini]|uniref:Uncharacterized protein n=1 Tax=Muricomes intestini TaxID=1796634 RepID=A0A4R3KB47_9FIRM|nr:hypothetical protein [Muricomes intestini]TCS80193.1 hypothetical protein EDD59_10616 [Muricomes intestini]
MLNDAAVLKAACDDAYDETSEYQLPIRVISEQTETSDDETLSLKTSASDMNSSILQNPADPDATYCKKAGTEYKNIYMRFFINL